MRVIAGKAKGFNLVAPETMDTRPTADRIKETLFNIIQFEVPGREFLDIFAGSGAIGIEALSRGAKKAVFIENSNRAIKAIEENLKHTKLIDNAEIIKGNFVSSLKSLDGKGHNFKIVYIDPPYRADYYKKTLSIVRTLSCVADDAIIILEMMTGDDASVFEELGYEIIRERDYRINKHIFMKKA